MVKSFQKSNEIDVNIIRTEDKIDSENKKDKQTLLKAKFLNLPLEQRLIIRIKGELYSELTINLDEKVNYPRIRKIKKYIKERFGFRKRFYLFDYFGEKVLPNIGRLQKENFEELKLLEVKFLNRRNRAGISKINEKLLKTIALVFKLFMKVDVNYFDRILETIKYANQKLYYYILLKKNTFLNMIFSSRLDKIEKNKKFIDKKVFNFIQFFKKIFYTSDEYHMHNQSREFKKNFSTDFGKYSNILSDYFKNLTQEKNGEITVKKSENNLAKVNTDSLQILRENEKLNNIDIDNEIYNIDNITEFKVNKVNKESSSYKEFKKTYYDELVRVKGNFSEEFDQEKFEIFKRDFYGYHSLALIPQRTCSFKIIRGRSVFIDNENSKLIKNNFIGY